MARWAVHRAANRAHRAIVSGAPDVSPQGAKAIKAFRSAESVVAAHLRGDDGAKKNLLEMLRSNDDVVARMARLALKVYGLGGIAQA